MPEPTYEMRRVPPPQLGKASGTNYMARRFGTVFAIAIGSAVFSAHGHLSNPAAVTAGFRPALWSGVVFAAPATVTAIAIPAHVPQSTTDPADVLVAA